MTRSLKGWGQVAGPPLDVEGVKVWSGELKQPRTALVGREF
jgi:hypothetical protein